MIASAHQTPAVVRITEVGPRDGLQNEKRPVPLAAKAELVRDLIDAGHTDIEVTAFVRPDRVPQMADAMPLLAALDAAPEGVVFSALVPNERGMQSALEAGVGKVAVFTAATDEFNLRNTNATIEASFARFRPVAEMRAAAGMALRGYISVAVACPFSGPVAPDQVADVVRGLLDLGCDEISVGDTIGAGTPTDIEHLLDAVQPLLGPDQLVMHFHDTRGMAAANVAVSLARGVSRFDASAGGLGGCPFAPDAAGNLATEDLIFLLDGAGIEHGVDLEGVKAASAKMVEHIGHPLPSRVHHAPPLD